MKVFKMNDCDWYMAENLIQAIDLYSREYGLDFDSEDPPRELTKEEMSETAFTFEDGEQVSFAEVLGTRLAQDNVEPELFASTEG